MSDHFDADEFVDHSDQMPSPMSCGNCKWFRKQLPKRGACVCPIVAGWDVPLWRERGNRTSWMSENATGCRAWRKMAQPDDAGREAQ